MREEIIPEAVAGHTLYQYGHLLVLPGQTTVHSVVQGVLVHGAGIDGAYRLLEGLIALLRRALIHAENALLFAGKGVAEVVFQKELERTMMGDWPKYSSICTNCSIISFGKDS